LNCRAGVPTPAESAAGAGALRPTTNKAAETVAFGDPPLRGGRRYIGGALLESLGINGDRREGKRNSIYLFLRASLRLARPFGPLAKPAIGRPPSRPKA